MWLRSYTNLLSLASRTVAMSILLVGLLLIAFGAVILAAPEVFAVLAAAVFFFIGLSLTLVAVRVLWTQRRLMRGSSVAYRQNVRIHTDEHSDPFNW
jgi:membrane protein implicated in regulation of membrane protease activity